MSNNPQKWFDDWWPRLRKVWIELRRPAHSRLAFAVVLAGLATATYVLWQPYMKAAVDDLVGKISASYVPSQEDVPPWIGVILAVAGLLYHLAATYLVALGASIEQAVFIDYLRNVWADEGSAIRQRVEEADRHFLVLLPELVLRRGGKVAAITPIDVELEYYRKPSLEFRENLAADKSLTERIDAFEKGVDNLSIATRRFNGLTFFRTSDFMLFLHPAILAIAATSDEGPNHDGASLKEGIAADVEQFRRLYEKYCGKAAADMTLGAMRSALEAHKQFRKDLDASLTEMDEATRLLRTAIDALKAPLHLFDHAFSKRQT